MNDWIIDLKLVDIEVQSGSWWFFYINKFFITIHSIENESNLLATYTFKKGVEVWNSRWDKETQTSRDVSANKVLTVE